MASAQTTKIVSPLRIREEALTLKMEDKKCGEIPPEGSCSLLVSCGVILTLALILVSCTSLGPKKVATCFSQNNIEMKDKYPSGQVGSILLVDDPSKELPMRQVFVAAFQFKGDEVEAQELLIVPGTGKIPYSPKCDFQFELVDMEGNLLAIYGIWNPRLLIADEDEKTGFVEVPTAKYVARFPFTAKAKEIRVRDAQNKVVASKDVRSAIMAFCDKYSDHPECRPDILK